MLATYFPRQNKLKSDQLMTPQEYLASERTLFLYGAIDEFIRRFDAFGPTMVMDSMLAFDKQSKDIIKLIIDSPGGYIHTGFALYDTIKSLNSTVATYGRNVQSMATIILAAGTKGHRYLYPSSRTMLHLPQAQLSGSSEDVKVQQKEVEFLKERMVDSLIACGAVKKRKDILKDIEREFWLSAEETIEYGIADKIVQVGDL